MKNVRERKKEIRKEDEGEGNRRKGEEERINEGEGGGHE